MKQMDLYIFLLLLVMIGLVLLIIFILFNNLNKQNKELIKTINDLRHDEINKYNELKNNFSHDLLKFNLNVTNGIKEDLYKLNETTTSYLNSIEKSVNDSLITSFDKTSKLMISISEKMAKIDETQNNLKELSLDIASLEGILKDKKTRGIFGEIELYNILDNVFNDNHNLYQKQYKLSNGNIADAVIFSKEPLNKIVIDSKFPLDNYNRIYDDNLTKAEKESAKNNFKKDIKKHIDDISLKYLIPNETADVAYMFIPAEAVFSEIYGHFNDVVEYSYQRHVYIVSPTTLLAYLTVLKSIYVDSQKDQKIIQIKEEFMKLAIEFKRFDERFKRLSKDFNKIDNEFRDVNISSDKIIKRFNEIDKVDLD